jgi:DNA excision repair protein ERCC-4
MVAPRIVADTREAASTIPRILERSGIYVQMKTLDIGDYVIGEYVVERKAVRDFLSSLYAGRLFEQAQRISQAYGNYLLIVEGDIQEVLADLRNPRAFWGALIALAFDMEFKLFFTLDQEQTAEFLNVFARRARRRRGMIRPLLVKKPRLATVRDRQLSILESLPTIGPKLGERLLRSFGSVRPAFTASLTELAVKGGVGWARAKKIQEVLDAQYPRAALRQTELPRA